MSDLPATSWSSDPAWAVARPPSRSPDGAPTSSSRARPAAPARARELVAAGGLRPSAATSRPSVGSTARAVGSRPACTTSSAATRRSTARACRGSARRDFECRRAPRGRLARVAVHLRRPRALLRRGRALSASTGRPARTRPSRGAARRSLPGRSARAATSPTSPTRLRAQGVASERDADGRRPRAGGTCIRCRTCDGFPCMARRQERRRDVRDRPALATGHARLLTGARVRRIVTDRDGPAVVGPTPTGPTARCASGGDGSCSPPAP